MSVHQANCLSARGDHRRSGRRSGRRPAAGQRAAEVLTRWSSELPRPPPSPTRSQPLNAARAGQPRRRRRPLEAGRQRARGVPLRRPVVQRALPARVHPRRPPHRRPDHEPDAPAASSTTTLRLEAPDNGARPHVEALRTSIEAARQLPSDPAWALTDAELKVLQYLPTNLTLADIATRLFVSRNTVKSHVAAIYRKLDATSRSDAVDLARQTGLLEDGPAERRD